MTPTSVVNSNLVKGAVGGGGILESKCFTVYTVRVYIHPSYGQNGGEGLKGGRGGGVIHRANLRHTLKEKKVSEN